MVTLTQLAPEILDETFQYLYDHHSTLGNLCLVGNHTVSAIAQKLFWREIHWRWNGALIQKEDEKSKRYQHQLVEYCSNAERAKAARYLDLEVFGKFSGDYSSNFFDIFVEEIPKFINITHLCINFSGVQVTFPSAQNVGCILYRLPALISLRLEGCIAQEDDWAAKYPLPDLECLSLWYCDSDYMYFAREACNLRVLEVVGGDGEEYWRNEKNGVGEFGGYDVLSSFSDYILEKKAGPDSDDEDDDDKDSEEEEEMTQLELRRLAVRCDCKEERCMDAYNVTAYIKRGIPHPDLEELVLQTPVTEQAYKGIVSHLAAPALEVLYVTVSQPESSRTFNKSRETEATQISFAGFPALSELWLPSRGLDVGIVLEHFILEENPSLTALYFDENDASDVDYSDLARQYVRRFPKLRFIGWKDSKLCKIKMKDGDVNVDIEEKEWREPPWVKFRGMGPWWESM